MKEVASILYSTMLFNGVFLRLLPPSPPFGVIRPRVIRINKASYLFRCLLITFVGRFLMHRIPPGCMVKVQLFMVLILALATDVPASGA